MIKKKLLLGVGLVLLSIIAHAETQVIRFASSVYPPFTFLNETTHELDGFDIAIAKALCGRMKVHCTFSNDRFSNMVSSLQTKKYDAWINAISISDERKKDVTFSKPYFFTTAKLIATKTTVFNAAPVEIKGKTIGVGEATCYLEYLKSTYGAIIKIKTFATKNEAYVALEKGLVDAVIDDAISARQWRLAQKDSKYYRLIDLPAKYLKLAWHKYGIAVAKGNAELAKKLNHALEHIKSDGTYNNLVKKYFAD